MALYAVHCIAPETILTERNSHAGGANGLRGILVIRTGIPPGGPAGAWAITREYVRR